MAGIRLQIRRGTNAERLQFTPFEGELVYTTDTKTVYIGDGVTAGGNNIGIALPPAGAAGNVLTSNGTSWTSSSSSRIPAIAGTTLVLQVNGATGSDTSVGSIESPFKTLAGAARYVKEKMLLALNPVVIKLAPGVYDGCAINGDFGLSEINSRENNTNNFKGNRYLTIEGDTADPSKVVINHTFLQGTFYSGVAVTAYGILVSSLGRVHLKGLNFRYDAAKKPPGTVLFDCYSIGASDHSYVVVENCIFEPLPYDSTLPLAAQTAEASLLSVPTSSYSPLIAISNYSVIILEGTITVKGKNSAADTGLTARYLLKLANYCQAYCNCIVNFVSDSVTGPPRFHYLFEIEFRSALNVSFNSVKGLYTLRWTGALATATASGPNYTFTMSGTSNLYFPSEGGGLSVWPANVTKTPLMHNTLTTGYVWMDSRVGNSTAIGAVINV